MTFKFTETGSRKCFRKQIEAFSLSSQCTNPQQVDENVEFFIRKCRQINRGILIDFDYLIPCETPSIFEEIVGNYYKEMGAPIHTVTLNHFIAESIEQNPALKATFTQFQKTFSS